MITCQRELERVRKEWAGVEALVGKLGRSAQSSAMGGGLFPHFLADAAANLPMFHAFGILNDVLKQLAEEGCFECKGRELGRLIEASKEALDWEDLDAIKKGKDARNGVAHEGKLLGRGDCWALIDVVRSELGAWGVI